MRDIKFKIKEHEYKKKIEELHLQIEIKARELNKIQQYADAAVNLKNKSELEKITIIQQIKDKELELERIQKNLENTKNIIAEENKSRTERINEFNKLLDSYKLKLDNLESNVNELEKKLINLKEKEKNYKILTDKTIIVSREYEVKKEEVEKLQNDIDKKVKELDNKEKILKDKEEKYLLNLTNFKNYESKIRFYYERMRKWYEDKGLKLPNNLEYGKNR